MSVSPARQPAFSILMRVELGSAYAVELLHAGLLDPLSPVDRNLATEIVMGVLRWRSALDHVIARFSFSPLRKLDLEVLTALRIGAYQKQFLSKIPSHAAVNETVELVKQAKKTSAAPLVNAVMRKIGRTGSQLPSPVSMNSSYLSGAYAHPSWLVERWVGFWSYDTAQKICAYDQQVPPSILRVKDANEEATLIHQGVHLVPGTLMKSARAIASGEITATEAFRRGQV